MSIQDFRRKRLIELLNEKKKEGFSVARLVREYEDFPEASYISQLKSGHRPFGEFLARKIEKSLGLPKFYFEPLAKDEISNFRPVSEWDENTPLDGDEVEIPYYKTLAFACGHGNENLITEDEETRKLRMSRFTLQRLGIYRDNTFSATADGDSMSPTINDGNTIFVDKGRTTIKDGKIFAVSYGGLHYCKRLYNLPNGGIRVVSDNKEEFPEFELTKKEIEEQEFVIIGWIYHWSNTERW